MLNVDVLVEWGAGLEYLLEMDLQRDKSGVEQCQWIKRLVLSFFFSFYVCHIEDSAYNSAN